VAATAVLLLALAACGARPQPVALPVLVAKVNAICTTYTVRIEALKAPPFAPEAATAAELGTAAAYLDRAVPLAQSEQTRIKAAGEPATDRDMFDEVLTALSAHVRDQGAARTAAHRRDLPAFRAAVAADRSDATHLAGVAQQFGLVKCV
jgi:hypothetical protein